VRFEILIDMARVRDLERRYGNLILAVGISNAISHGKVRVRLAH